MRTFGFRVKNHLKNNDYDIIIDNQSLSYGVLDLQKENPLIEIIHHPISKDYEHELETNNKFLYKLSRHRWYSFLKMQKKVAPKLQTIVTPSVNSLKDIATDFHCDPKKITVINNGIDIDIFIPHNNIERRKFRLITTASADVPLKGLDYSLMALNDLKDEYPNIELIVIGKIKKDGHTSKLIKKLGIKDSIKFKTNLSKEEIAKEYAKSSISIVSSLYEGFGYPVIEAMSCAVPLVAANTSSIPELVGDYATLIPAKSSKELAESIKDIFSDYVKYKNIAEAGRQHIIDNFNWLKITQEYENIIYKTIEEHKNADL